MKKILLFIGVITLIGCNNEPIDPPNGSLTTDPSHYGSSAVVLPRVQILDASDAIYSLKLTIAGHGMTAIEKAWKLTDRDTAVMIEKIPVGAARVFSGYLISSKEGVVCEGSDTVDIYAGKVAQVYLTLHRTGNAVVHINIDGLAAPTEPVQPTIASACYEIKGSYKETPFDACKLNLTFSGSYASGVFMQKGVVIGKLSGPILNDQFVFNVHLISSLVLSYPTAMIWKGAFVPAIAISKPVTESTKNPPIYQYPMFKAGIFDGPGKDTTAVVGYAYGNVTICTDTVIVNPPLPVENCVFDSIVFALGTDPKMEALKRCPAIGSGSSTMRILQMPDASGKKGIMIIQCCTPVVPRPSGSSTLDTMGGETSCKSIQTWQQYAADECKQKGMKLGKSSFMTPCFGDSLFRYICYECLK